MSVKVKKSIGLGLYRRYLILWSPVIVNVSDVRVAVESQPRNTLLAPSESRRLRGSPVKHLRMLDYAELEPVRNVSDKELSARRGVTLIQIS